MSVDTIVATAKNLQGLISQHLTEGETRAHTTPEIVAAVGKAGMFRLYAPKEVGGLEVPPPISLAALEAIAAADPAVAWYMANSVPACLAAASLPEAERSELFADKDLNFGFSAAVLGRANPTDGGYSLSGQWPVVTGCEDSKWCALAGLVMDGDTPRQQAPRIRISRGGGRARDDQPFVYPRDACGVYAREPRRAGRSQYSCDSIHVRKRAEFSSCSGPSADGWRPSRPIVLKENEETAAVAI